ncbi:GntR family transcriptional regulator [Streptomyces sp. SID8352]|uniref:GntR family transcriptional regulator n=1 Tax=Streptomyces sp. SID8352 TaxID=2690338 RepID=UPI001370EE03|nr:GntR family transcriptional regulator [Streptomyces sp. SID8352]MYU22638.1 FCD domain-containing protein [Streptomyces sp. SID8352]
MSEVNGGAAMRVADLLRAEIRAGTLRPGQRLSEEHFRARYGVSRSSLREAFRLLVRDRLLVHELSRGVFVREPTRAELRDLYRVRRVIECAALRQVETLTPVLLRQLAEAIEEGKRAAGEGQWELVASASIRFHQTLVALAGSERLNEIMDGVLAEHRLAYALMKDTQVFHLGFLNRHEAIADTLRAGDLDGAAALLDQYLRDSERAVLD